MLILLLLNWQLCFKFEKLIAMGTCSECYEAAGIQWCCSILPVQIGKERPPPEQVQVHVPMDCYEWYKELKMECPGCGILRCKRDWTPAQWDTQDPCIHGRQFCMVCDQWTQLQGQHRSQGARSSSTFGISLQEPQAGCLIGILFHGLWNIPHFNRSVFHPKKN